LSVPFIELPPLKEIRDYDHLDAGRNFLDHHIDALGMQIGAESLKLGREQDHIGAIHLLRREMLPRTRPANAPKHRLDGVEASRSLAPPFV